MRAAAHEQAVAHAQINQPTRRLTVPGGRRFAPVALQARRLSCVDWLYNVALLGFVFQRTGSPTWVAITTAARHPDGGPRAWAASSPTAAIAAGSSPPPIGPASALRATVGQTAIVIEPALGALLLLLSSPSIAILLNGLTFAASAAAILAIGPGAALRGRRRLRDPARRDGDRRRARRHGRRPRPLPERLVAHAGDRVALVTVGLVAMGMLPTLAGALAGALLAGGGMVVSEVLSDAALPTMLDDAVLARAYGLIVPTSLGGIVVGSLVAGPLATLLGLPGALAAVAVVALGAAALLGRRGLLPVAAHDETQVVAC